MKQKQTHRYTEKLIGTRGKEVGEMVKKVKVNRGTNLVRKLVSPGDKSMYRIGNTVSNIVTLVSDAYYT